MGDVVSYEHKKAKRELRKRALAALMIVSRKELYVLERARDYLAGLPIVPSSWKDGSPRCAGSALEVATGLDVDIVARRLHVDAWTDLCNFVEWYQAEAVPLFDEAIREVQRA